MGETVGSSGVLRGAVLRFKGRFSVDFMGQIRSRCAEFTVVERRRGVSFAPLCS
jgi:hypothetical protein